IRSVRGTFSTVTVLRACSGGIPMWCRLAATNYMPRDLALIVPTDFRSKHWTLKIQTVWMEYIVIEILAEWSCCHPTFSKCGVVRLSSSARRSLGIRSCLAARRSAAAAITDLSQLIIPATLHIALR
ncbi:hypothetical protein J6590_004780, partial [Homalodisca vitripennis]